MTARRAALLALAAITGWLANPRGRARALRLISAGAGHAGAALRSLSLAAGARYLDLAYPPETAAADPAQE